MNVEFLGTASCFPTPSRGVSCIALQLEDGQVWLFDCGEGSQIQLQKSSIKAGKITKIFITHLHGDHLFGLPGLLCTLGNGGNTERKSVDIYGPLGLRKYIATTLELSRSPLNYKYNVHELIPKSDQYPQDWNDWPTELERRQYEFPKEELVSKIENINNVWEIYEDQKYIVRAAALVHRIPSFGFVIEERDQPGCLNVKKLQEIGIKHGPIFGKLKSGHTVTHGDKVLHPRDYLGDPIKGRKVVILGDTCDSKEMIQISQNADVIIHEATMEESLREKAIEYGHSTPSMAVDFALETNTLSLILTHVSPRYLPISVSEANEKKNLSAEILLEEAKNHRSKQICPESTTLNIHLAHDFLKMPIAKRKNSQTV